MDAAWPLHPQGVPVSGAGVLTKPVAVGADKTAFDWPIFHDLSHDGWFPEDQKAEDGPLAGHYRLKETPCTP